MAEVLLAAPDCERYARHASLEGFGLAAQERLARASVLVVGAGGLGSPVITYLAAAGVGRLTICDDDTVSLSNLQRQVVHVTRDIGRGKAESAATRARHLNPDVDVRVVTHRLTGGNADALLAGHDVAVDATDTFASRRELAAACGRAGVPEVYGAVLGWTGQVTVIEPGRTLEGIFGELPDEAPTCASAGILASVPGVIGGVLATETLKLLTGTGEPLTRRLQTYDARTGAWRTLTLPEVDTP